MMMKRHCIFLIASASPLVWASHVLAAPNVGALQDLGKRVFFDNISVPARQSCSSCHDADNGWTGTVAAINRGQVAITGANPHTVGGRKPPAVAYASRSPDFGDSIFAPFPGACQANIVGLFCAGGVFWDGRATGTGIGNEVFAGDVALSAAYDDFLGPLADQALGPFACTSTTRPR